MSNFFSFDSDYQYEPVIKSFDPKIVEKDIDTFRRKILEAINTVVNQKELSRSELALAGRVSGAIAGKILLGNLDKISTDRLLRIARRLGLKAKVRFAAET